MDPLFAGNPCYFKRKVFTTMNAQSAIAAGAPTGASKMVPANPATMKIDWSKVEKGPKDFDMVEGWRDLEVQGGRKKRNTHEGVFSLGQIGFASLAALTLFRGGAATAH